jgi:hypothetical protein
LRLRPEDLASLGRQMWELVSRYADQQRPPDDPEAERVVVYLHAFPTKDVVL